MSQCPKWVVEAIWPGERRYETVVYRAEFAVTEAGMLNLYDRGDGAGERVSVICFAPGRWRAFERVGHNAVVTRCP